MEVDDFRFSKQRLQNVANTMGRLGFTWCTINPDGYHRMEKHKLYRHFKVTISIIFYTMQCAIWIDPDAEMLFCNTLPSDIKDDIDLDDFVDGLVFNLKG